MRHDRYDALMWNAYIDVNLAHPLLAAALQFALLGTLGEVVSIRVRGNKVPWGPTAFALKVLGWALLGVYIKFMFVTASSGVAGFASYLGVSWLSVERSLPNAFVTSALMNIMLGPSMVILHRLWDNAVAAWTGDKAQGWAGIQKAMGTLVWLWIPLHTFTFTQVREVRIGIAALLSLVLGIVLGLTSKRR